MTLLEWISLNLFFDIFSVIFILFLLYKNQKLSNKQKQIDNLLYEVIRNPISAKRRLKKRQ